MTRIHDLLQREGFEGSYDAVRRSAWPWSEARRKDAGDGAPAFIPLLFQPGEAHQLRGARAVDGVGAIDLLHKECRTGPCIPGGKSWTIFIPPLS